MTTPPRGGRSRIRLHVLHNAAGDIFGLAAEPEDAPPATFSPPTGLMLSDVDVAGIDIALESPDTVERLTDLMNHHQLGPETARRLIRRSGTSTE